MSASEEVADDDFEYELASTLQDLGNAAFRLGDYSDARKKLEESLSLKRKYYDSNRVGATSKLRGDDDDVDHRVLHRNLDLAMTLEELGRVCFVAEDYTAAKRAYNEALDLKRLVYNKQLVTASSVGKGKLGMKQQCYGYDRAHNSDLA